MYLQQHQKAVHAVYDPTDTLLYPGVDKLIISLNFMCGHRLTSLSHPRRPSLEILGLLRTCTWMQSMVK